MSYHILPECYADTTMMEVLGFKKANHCTSIGEVANRMQKNYKNRLAIGVIDNDKPGAIPSYFDDFETEEDYGGLLLKRLPDTKHYLIVVSPAIEGFLIDTAEDLGVPLKDYGFENLKKLKRVTKHQNIAKNEKFKSLINRLGQKKNSPLKSAVKKINELLDQET